MALENWNKTPNDFGVPWDDVDPCYLEAMMVIKAGYSIGVTSTGTRGKRPH